MFPNMFISSLEGSKSIAKLDGSHGPPLGYTADSTCQWSPFLLYDGFCCGRMNSRQNVNLNILLPVHCVVSVCRKKAEEECRRRERNPSKSDDVSDK